MPPTERELDSARQKHRAQRFRDLINHHCGGRNKVLAEKLKDIDQPISECLISQYKRGRRVITEKTIDRIEGELSLRGWFSAVEAKPEELKTDRRTAKLAESEASHQQYRRQRLRRLIDEHCFGRTVILVERLTLAGKRIADCTISQYLSGTRSITSNAVERIETAINLKGWFSANDGDLSEDAPPRSVLEAPQWVPPAPQVQANEAKVQLVAPNPAPLIQSPVETCSAAGAIAAPMLDIPFERRLWNVADIANYLRCSPRHTADRIINLPGFPAGFALPLGESDTDGNQLWYAREVVEWALSFQRKR